MGTLTEAFYARLHATHEPTEEFYNKNQKRDKQGRWTRGVAAARTPGSQAATLTPTKGKIWSGVSAHPTDRVKPIPSTELKNAFKIENDWKANEALANRMYTADLGGGYHSAVVEAEPAGDYRNPMLYVRGVIMKGTREVGTFERTVGQDENGIVVSHDELIINGSHQGKGLGDRFNSHAIAEYQRIGVDRIVLHAGDTVGGYAWARQGFRFDEGEGTGQRQKFLNERLTQIEAQAKWTPFLKPISKELLKTIAALRKAIEAGEDVQPIHIASIGEKVKWDAQDDNGNTYTTWAGKQSLLRTRWSGVYYFDAEHPVTAAAMSLEHADLRPQFRADVIEFFEGVTPFDKRQKSIQAAASAFFASAGIVDAKGHAHAPAGASNGGQFIGKTSSSHEHPDLETLLNEEEAIAKDKAKEKASKGIAEILKKYSEPGQTTNILKAIPDVHMANVDAAIKNYGSTSSEHVVAYHNALKAADEALTKPSPVAQFFNEPHGDTSYVSTITGKSGEPTLDYHKKIFDYLSDEPDAYVKAVKQSFKNDLVIYNAHIGAEGSAQALAAHQNAKAGEGMLKNFATPSKIDHLKLMEKEYGNPSPEYDATFKKVVKDALNNAENSGVPHDVSDVVKLSAALAEHMKTATGHSKKSTVPPIGFDLSDAESKFEEQLKAHGYDVIPGYTWANKSVGKFETSVNDEHGEPQSMSFYVGGTLVQQPKKVVADQVPALTEQSRDSSVTSIDFHDLYNGSKNPNTSPANSDADKIIKDRGSRMVAHQMTTQERADIHQELSRKVADITDINERTIAFDMARDGGFHNGSNFDNRPVIDPLDVTLSMSLVSYAAQFQTRFGYSSTEYKNAHAEYDEKIASISGPTLEAKDKALTAYNKAHQESQDAYGTPEYSAKLSKENQLDNAYWEAVKAHNAAIDAVQIEGRKVLFEKLKEPIMKFKEEFVEHKDPAKFVADVFHEYGISPESALVSYTNKKWAESSRSDVSVALSRILGKEMDMRPAVDSLNSSGLYGSTSENADGYTRMMGKSLRHVGAATYRFTQSKLKEHGITELVLERGVTRDEIPDGNVHRIIAQPAPLSSWTTNHNTAVDFTTSGHVFQARIPVNQVYALSTLSGTGALGEYEVILLGRPIQATQTRGTIVNTYASAEPEPADDWADVPVVNIDGPDSADWIKDVQRKHKAERS